MSKPKEWVDLICDECGCQFKRELSKHKWGMKVGRKTLCSRKCAGIRYQKNTIKQKLDKKTDNQKIFEDLLKRARSSQRKKSERFDISITVDDIAKIWHIQDGKCALTNIPMILKKHIGGGRSLFNQASIDRIDSNKGYTIDNIRIVCLMANYAKHDFSDNDFIQFCTHIVNTH